MKTATSNYKWFLNVFDQLLLPAVSLLDTFSSNSNSYSYCNSYGHNYGHFQTWPPLTRSKTKSKRSILAISSLPFFLVVLNRRFNDIRTGLIFKLRCPREICVCLCIV